MILSEGAHHSEVGFFFIFINACHNALSNAFFARIHESSYDKSSSFYPVNAIVYFQRNSSRLRIGPIFL